jgi:hypothetical protein
MTTKSSIALADLLEKGTASPAGECLAPPSNLDGTLVIGSAPCIPQFIRTYLGVYWMDRRGTDWARIVHTCPTKKGFLAGAPDLIGSGSLRSIPEERPWRRTRT